jgi:hypothetical protein
MRAVMTNFFSLEADHPLRPPLPLQRGPSWRGSCELTGAKVIRGSRPVTQLATWTTRFLATEANRLVPIHLYNRSTQRLRLG